MSKVMVTLVVCGLISAPLFQPTTAKAQVPAGNLLVNPGAETGDLTGWQVGFGGATATVDNGSTDPGINPHSGSFDFYGGTGAASGVLAQRIDLTTFPGLTALVDTGTLTANVGFWEQSLNEGPLSDRAIVSLLFSDSINDTIGDGSTPSVASINGAWQFTSDSFAIPSGTRTIDYFITFAQTTSGDPNIDSFVDDNSLTITGGVAAAPEPGTLALLGTPLIGLLACRSRKRR